jgi:hypothetical protein
MSLTVRGQTVGIATALALFCASSASAQKVTTVPDLTAQQTLGQLAGPLAPRPAAEAIGLTTALEIATAPFGTSSGGFVFKLDPSTGLLTRTNTTFGPSFTERASTAGEGQISIGATFSSTSYDKITDLPLDNLQLGVTGATTALRTFNGSANLDLTAKTVAISTTVGVSENFDVGVVVPLISLKLTGTSSLVRGDGVVARLAETSSVYGGIGDVSALAKYRFFKFPTADLRDAGGMAIVVNMRLPTGDRDNLRGLGVTRTLGSLVFSAGKGRLKPHASGGFEYWSKGVGAPTDLAARTGVEARHQIVYAAGVELEATPKVTFNVDFLGQQIRGAGQVGYVSDTPPAGSTGINTLQSLVALSDGIRKALLVPGLKVNLKGKMLLSLNAIITMKNDGLHSTVTPVVGVNLTM